MSERVKTVTVLLSVSLAGCFDFKGAFESCRDGGRCGDAGSSVQVALQTVTRHTEGSAISTPTQFLSSDFTLYVRNGEQFTQVTTGGPTAAGRFVFSAVPPGQRYLRRGDYWLVDPPATVDFSYRTFGRADTAVADGGVRLEVASSGMNAWVDGSELELVSPNAGFMGFAFEAGLTTPPTPQGLPTTLGFDYSFAYSDYWGADVPIPLINTQAGDVAYLTQLEASSLSITGGEVVPLRTLVKAATLSPLAMAKGTVKVTGAFTAPPQVNVSVDWRRAAYWALGPQVTPNLATDTSSDSLGISVIPYFGDEGIYEQSADLLIAGGEKTAAHTADLAFAKSLRNPYPASWVITLYLEFCHYGLPQSTGGDLTFQPYACSRRWEPLDAVNGHALTPGLGPPIDLKVDGQPAYGTLTLKTTVPTVSWSPPTVGAPDSYEVEVRRVYDAGGWLDSEWVGSVLSHTTTVMMPPGVLYSGESYYLVVIALKGIDGLATPFKTAPSREIASGLSAVLRVQ